MPVKQNFQTKIGNTTPDLVWGITNTFKYKNFTLSFTLDGRVGGLSYSKTHQMLWNTGAGIDTDTQWRYEESPPLSGSAYLYSLAQRNRF